MTAYKQILWPTVLPLELFRKTGADHIGACSRKKESLKPVGLYWYLLSRKVAKKVLGSDMNNLHSMERLDCTATVPRTALMNRVRLEAENNMKKVISWVAITVAAISFGAVQVHAGSTGVEDEIVNVDGEISGGQMGQSFIKRDFRLAAPAFNPRDMHDSTILKDRTTIGREYPKDRNAMIACIGFCFQRVISWSIAHVARRDLHGPDLQRFLVDPYVYLAPNLALPAAMFSGVPLAFALGLDACTIHCPTGHCEAMSREGIRRFSGPVPPR